MTGLLSYWRLWRRLWHIECTEQTILFRERHRMSPLAMLFLYLVVAGVFCIMALPGALGIITRGGGPASWSAIFVGANGVAILFTAFVFFSVRNTVIRVDPAHLHVGWRGIELHEITQWQRVEGALTSEWRRKLVRPMGFSALSLGSWTARGNVAGVFCPVWMRTALLIEVEGLREPEHVLVGTRRPEEFEAALVQATSKLGPRHMDLSWLDDLKP
jgi:Protein of unknown function (DUF3093)